jgi:hypothetical protein
MIAPISNPMEMLHALEQSHLPDLEESSLVFQHRSRPDAQSLSPLATPGVRRAQAASN